MPFEFVSGSRGLPGVDGVDAAPVPATGSFADSFTVYLDRERTWFAGKSTYASPVLPKTVGTLSAQYRPSATVYVPCTLISDTGGTPAVVAGYYTVTSAGVVAVNATASVSGNVDVLLDGTSFRVAASG